MKQDFPIASLFDEATLFRLAAQLEKAQPCFGKHSDVWAS
jgi:hypothetical protein